MSTEAKLADLQAYVDTLEGAEERAENCRLLLRGMTCERDELRGALADLVWVWDHRRTNDREHTATTLAKARGILADTKAEA